MKVYIEEIPCNVYSDHEHLKFVPERNGRKPGIQSLYWSFYPAQIPAYSFPIPVEDDDFHKLRVPGSCDQSHRIRAHTSQ